MHVDASGFGDIYCGNHNCYDVLKVTRDDDKAAIRKAYHQLARTHHPDRQRTADGKEKAQELFRLINTAYEILSDPDQRQEYDYMLDNPEEMYLNYYRYYRRRYAKVDVRLVILAIILLFSTIQYIGQWTSYNQALSYLVRDPKHRAMAREVAQTEGLFNTRRLTTKGGKRLTREEIKDREEEILRTIISRQVDVRGDGSKPTLRRVLLVQILIFPYTCALTCKWAGDWVWRYWILRQEYDPAAQEFLTRRRFGMGAEQWDSLREADRQAMLKQRLWISTNYQAHVMEEQEKMRIRAAENSQQKRYRRYLKQAGPQKIELDF